MQLIAFVLVQRPYNDHILIKLIIIIIIITFVVLIKYYFSLYYCNIIIVINIIIKNIQYELIYHKHLLT